MDSEISIIYYNLKTLEPKLDFKIMENKIWKIGGAAFTVDKKYIFLCTKSDLNTMTYVALHELSHVKSKNWGHGPEFVKTFKELVKRAIHHGFYKYQDYSQSPINYCNFNLNTQIL